MEIHRRDCLQQLTVASLACCGCRSAPVTGRRQLMLMPEQSEIGLGLQAYEEATKGTPLSQHAEHAELVNRVGQRIAQVSDRSDYQWEFRLLASPEQNAFALPGGKVAIYEGILPVCQNEAGLAVVMSHEVAHALARHGGERMSQNLAVDGVQRVASTVIQQRAPSKHDTFLQAYGVATEYGVLLPYNRKQESEADHIGLMLMARAGYDPSEAPHFWSRFGTLKAGEKPPEFLSTHPSDARRSADLQLLQPEAVALYAAAEAQLGKGQLIVVPAGTLPPAGQPEVVQSAT